jgi:hypothetical protein
VGGAAQTGGTAFASSFFVTGPPNWTPDRLFDNNGATNWAASTNAFPQWVGMDYGVGANVEVEETAIRSRQDGAADQAPGLFVIQRTVDDPATSGARWYDHSLKFNASGWSLGETRLFLSPTPAVLTIYKLTANAWEGGLDAGLIVSKFGANALIDAVEGRLTVSKFGANVLSGAEPNRLTLAKFSANVLSGAEPNRITVAKVGVNVLLFMRPRLINGPVQII